MNGGVWHLAQIGYGRRVQKTKERQVNNGEFQELSEFNPLVSFKMSDILNSDGILKRELKILI